MQYTYYSYSYICYMYNHASLPCSVNPLEAIAIIAMYNQWQ